MSSQPPQLESLEGQILAGRFKLGELLGQGGYGAVFAAQQLSIERSCAVKVIHTSFDSELEDVLGRFRAEAIATSQLHHPNTVIIYDFGQDPALDVLFLAMEHIDGENLADLLDRKGFLSLDVSLHIIAQIASSLHNAHQTGIVHRDIKPANIMLVARGQDTHFVKVIDFGIARVLGQTTQSTMDRLTMTGVMIGTPHYMAPEQIRNQDVDGRTDLYALAICLYRMLAGRTPFQGGTAVDIACQQLTDRPLPLSVYAPHLGLSSAFDDVLLMALEKNKTIRQPDVMTFVEQLYQAAGLQLPQSFIQAPVEPTVPAQMLHTLPAPGLTNPGKAVRPQTGQSPVALVDASATTPPGQASMGARDTQSGSRRALYLAFVMAFSFFMMAVVLAFVAKLKTQNNQTKQAESAKNDAVASMAKKELTIKSTPTLKVISPQLESSSKKEVVEQPNINSPTPSVLKKNKPTTFKRVSGTKKSTTPRVLKKNTIRAKTKVPDTRPSTKKKSVTPVKKTVKMQVVFIPYGKFQLGGKSYKSKQTLELTPDKPVPIVVQKSGEEFRCVLQPKEGRSRQVIALSTCKKI